MALRVFTVGSLIPGRMAAVKQTQQEPSLQKSPVLEKIIVQQGGRQFEILPVKGKLLDAALHQGEPLQFKCRKGTCGQCAVKVVQGPGLSEPNEKELNKLKNEIGNGYRLACQTEIV